MRPCMIVSDGSGLPGPKIFDISKTTQSTKSNTMAQNKLF